MIDNLLRSNDEHSDAALLKTDTVNWQDGKHISDLENGYGKAVGLECSVGQQLGKKLLKHLGAALIVANIFK